MEDLKTIAPKEIVWNALVELRVAIAQSIDSDDQIIMGHVRKAEALLSTIAVYQREKDHG